MSLTHHVGAMQPGPDLVGRLVYGALLPMFLTAEGLRRLSSRLSPDAQDVRPSSPSWLAEACCGAKIAASYLQHARHELNASERKSRPVRPS
jgi:hypothetical protein